MEIHISEDALLRSVFAVRPDGFYDGWMLDGDVAITVIGNKMFINEHVVEDLDKVALLFQLGYEDGESYVLPPDGMLEEVADAMQYFSPPRPIFIWSAPFGDENPVEIVKRLSLGIRESK